MVSVAGPVAFVLPGGAAWGAVQVGMLRALTDAGIVPSLIVGTSVGALNGAMFSATPTSEGVARLADAWCAARRAQIFPLRPTSLARAVVHRRGHLLDSAGLHRWVRAHLGFERLEHAPVPLHVMATDVATHVPVMLSSGDALDALMASCAIPGVFPPVEIEGRLLADGGSTANHPVPQALALGAATVFQLSTYGRRAERDRALLVRLVGALDRRFGSVPGGIGDGQPGVPVHPLRREPVVHVLPAPATEDVNPFTFRQSASLIAQAADLTAGWLAEHLAASHRGDVPLLPETLAQVEEHPA